MEMEIIHLGASPEFLVTDYHGYYHLHHHQAYISGYFYSRLTVKWTTLEMPGPIPFEAAHKYSPASYILVLGILSVPFS